MITIISIILLIILSIILFIIYNIKKKHLEKEYKKEYYNNQLQEFEAQRRKLDEDFERHKEEAMHKYSWWLSEKEKERDAVEKSLIERKQAVEEIIEQLENRRSEAEKAHLMAIAAGKDKIDIELEGYRKHRQEILNNTLVGEFAEKRALSLKEFNEFSEQLTTELNNAKQELLSVLEELGEYKKKQAAYNAEILRRREVEEKQDFYRVILEPSTISDIEVLLAIREKLIYRENLDKLIYDVYVAKPVMEMIKRVLKGAAPSGIYKITRIKTGEVYIGKSTDIKKRWTEHCKTAYGVGSIAHSILHTTIKRDGIENFTFELLEEVPKDKLTEREKYWITFYDSKNYGLNERNG